MIQTLKYTLTNQNEQISDRLFTAMRDHTNRRGDDRKFSNNKTILWCQHKNVYGYIHKGDETDLFNKQQTVVAIGHVFWNHSI